MATITYMNQGAVRSMPLDPRLVAVYQAAAAAAGIDEIRVMSGGQPATGPGRVGSTRHDHGSAGDIQLVKGGRVLDFTQARDLPFFETFVANASRGGAVGIGAGVDYMGPRTIHVGFGKPAVWGAGGKGENAPDWLRRSMMAGGTVEPGAGLSAYPSTYRGGLDQLLNLNGSPLLNTMTPTGPAAAQPTPTGPQAGNPFFSRFGVTPGGMTIFGGQPERMNPFFTPEMRSM